MSAPASSRSWCAADGRHLDLRGLAPPGPMVAILGALDGADPPPMLVVHLDRDPTFLYPELAERGWSARAEPGDAGEVRLRIAREA